LAQVAEALDMLHDQGLVHLDVKPANVLVTTRESANEHVYLADFGLTRRGATGHRTRSGDFLGSPTYAAPEHLRGEPVDGRTDEYALTCVLFACLTGRPPFQGQVPDVIAGHLTREVPSVTSLVLLPAAVDVVIRKGMAKEPGGRYPDCRSLIAAARSAMASVARPGTPPMVRGGVQQQPLPSGPLPVQQQPVQQQQPQQVQQQQRPLGPPSAPGGYPVQQQPQQPRPPMQYPHAIPGASGEPVRLRPPTPVNTSAFAPERGLLSRWGLPILVGVAAIVVIVVLIIAFT
jgi:serine/threonine-protein kinase